MHLKLVFVSIVIGMFIGAVGVGGLFLPSALVLITHISLHQSMATSLFTFIFTGITGTLFYHRKGSIDWSMARPVCAGAAIAGFAGAVLNSHLSMASLSVALSLIIIFAGVYTFRSNQSSPAPFFENNRSRQRMLLIGIGAIAGFASGLTGVGGPVVAMPLMVMCGFPILAAIGVSQVMQIVSATSGSLANFHFGTIDFSLAFFIVIFEIAGVLLGGYLVHRIDAAMIKKWVGALCLTAGSWLMLRSVGAL